jgi:hypothetical protein
MYTAGIFAARSRIGDYFLSVMQNFRKKIFQIAIER